MSFPIALWSCWKRRADRSLSSSLGHRRALKPVVADSVLEERKLLTTYNVSYGAYSVRLWTRDYTSSDRDIYARVSYHGRVIRDNIVVANSNRWEGDPSLAINSRGRFVVAWEDRLNSRDSDIKVRVFGSNGRALTSAMTVNTSSRREFDPEVAINNAGRFVVAYTQQFSSSDLDVHARQYYPRNSAGTSYSATSYTVANVANRNEFDPEVRVNANGNWAVSYSYRYNSRDLDAKVYVRRTNGRANTYNVATSSSNETSTRVDSYSGNTLKVSYLKGGRRYVRTLRV